MMIMPPFHLRNSEEVNGPKPKAWSLSDTTLGVTEAGIAASSSSACSTVFRNVPNIYTQYADPRGISNPGFVDTEGAMPSGMSGMYHALEGFEDVYRSTTVAGEKQGVLNTVKKALAFGNTKEESFLEKNCNLVASRTDNTNTLNSKKMPTSGVAEEAALLGTMPSDSMDDIELKNIQLQFPAVRSMSRDESVAHEETVETDRGPICVAVQGNRSKPAILTYHDLGLNYISSFQAFFNYIDMRVLLENFCVYHVNAPGQEEGASTLADDYVFPTMDELATQVEFVLSHFGLKYIIGVGVGAGANILARYSLLNPNKVVALCLINCPSTQAGWIEWGYQKLNARHLRSKGMTQGVLDYLMWHHFGRNTEERNHDLVQVYKSYFEKNVNPTNLALFIDSYVKRTDLNITREHEVGVKSVKTLRMPVLNITGAFSPHVEDTVTLNGRLDPTNSTWMKISDCGMVLEEQPGKVSEAFRLFLQGEGYAAPLSPTKMAFIRQSSIDELFKTKQQQNGPGALPSSAIRITENPISTVDERDE